MDLKGFLKPTISRIVLSVLMLVAWNLYIMSLPPMMTTIPVNPVSLSSNIIRQIILYIISYLISCLIVTVYSKLKKK